jgi:SAM-dependent methyltransferase
MQQFWEERYGESEYAYGEAPNAFFAEQLTQIATPGKLLLPADGEGRNSVFAATRGWESIAFDYSAAGKGKALQLAQKKGVAIDFTVADIATYPFPSDYFDVVGLFFVHLPPPLRLHLHQQVIKALKPGGTLLLEGFAKEQLGKPSGGPKQLDMLFSEAELRSELTGLTIEKLDCCNHQLQEGKYHQGPASTIQLIAKK